MTAFNWGRMDQTPHGKYAKSEKAERSTMSLQERVKSYEVQAQHDLDEHGRFNELLRDIEKQLDVLIRGGNMEKERAAQEIARRHSQTLRNDKGIEEESEQIAYIIALAEAKHSQKPQTH